MGRQRNMPQKKEQEQSPELELIKMEATKILDAGFKTVIIKMLKDLRGRQMILVRT